MNGNVTLPVAGTPPRAATVRQPPFPAFSLRVQRSLGVKLFAFLFLALLATLGVLGYLNISLHRRNLEAATLASTERVSDVIKRSTSYYMMRNDREALYHIIRTMAAEPGMVRVRVFNQEGRISYSTQQTEVGTLVDKSAEACYHCHAQSEPLAHLNRPDRFRIYQLKGDRVLGIITPIVNTPDCSSAACHAHPKTQKVLGVLDTNVSLASADEGLRASTWRMLGYSVFAILAISMLSGAFVWQFVHKPVKSLRKGTERLTRGELGYQIHVQSQDELGVLADSFNHMSRQLLDAREEITAWTRTLEKRVDQKTRELRKAHEQMLQTERLTTLGKMSAVVAHEINNPLSGILTYARLMRKWIDRGDPLQERAQEMRESLQLIESESRRCGDIVKNLLTFARTQPLNIGPVDLNAAIRHVTKLLEHNLALTSIDLRLELEEGLPPILGDAAQLQQVLLALCINAIEAMGKDGELRISTRSEADAVRIYVDDNGPGIPAEILPRLFEPFVSSKENGTGTGLGLAISKSIVERHSGAISVSSDPGKGTSVSILLPLEEQGLEDELKDTEVSIAAPS